MEEVDTSSTTTTFGAKKRKRTHARRTCTTCRDRKTRCILPEASLDVPSSTVPLSDELRCARCARLKVQCVVFDDERKAREGKPPRYGPPSASMSSARPSASASAELSPITSAEGGDGAAHEELDDDRHWPVAELRSYLIARECPLAHFAQLVAAAEKGKAAETSSAAVSYEHIRSFNPYLPATAPSPTAPDSSTAFLGCVVRQLTHDDAKVRRDFTRIIQEAAAHATHLTGHLDAAKALLLLAEYAPPDLLVPTRGAPPPVVAPGHAFVSAARTIAQGLGASELLDALLLVELDSTVPFDEEAMQHVALALSISNASSAALFASTRPRVHLHDAPSPLQVDSFAAQAQKEADAATRAAHLALAARCRLDVLIRRMWLELATVRFDQLAWAAQLVQLFVQDSDALLQDAWRDSPNEAHQSWLRVLAAHPVAIAGEYIVFRSLFFAVVPQGATFVSQELITANMRAMNVDLRTLQDALGRPASFACSCILSQISPRASHAFLQGVPATFASYATLVAAKSQLEQVHGCLVTQKRKPPIKDLERLRRSVLDASAAFDSMQQSIKTDEARSPLRFAARALRYEVDKIDKALARHDARKVEGDELSLAPATPPSPLLFALDATLPGSAPMPDFDFSALLGPIDDFVW